VRGRRRRFWIIGIVVVAAVLLAPLCAGYWGPRAAAYAQTWRPWRTHLSVQLNPAAPDMSSKRVMAVVEYRDPWPGTGRTSGQQTDFETVTRPDSLLPWIVTGHGTGP
jgi:hypothetical protein